MSATAAMPRAPAAVEPMDRQQYATRLKELSAALESGNDVLFMQRLNELTKVRAQPIVIGVARLTHKLHEAIHGLQSDSRLAQIAGQELPDAAGRLDFVLKTTEDAAHHTLDLVEAGRALTDIILKQTDHLGRVRVSAFDEADDGAAVAYMAREVARVQTDTFQAATRLRQHLSEMVLAQGYQDITGQIIRKVVALMRQVEKALVDLVRASGQIEPIVAPPPVRPGDTTATGPAVPGLDPSVSQKDADSLLSRLGL